jgi:phospholipid transport system substrate-binding protein
MPLSRSPLKSWILGAAAAAALALSSLPAAALDCPAAGYITNAANALIGAARSGSPSAISSTVARYTDMRGIALFALGPYRSKLPPSRQAEYVSLTRSFIGRFMASYADEFKSAGFTPVSCSQSGGAVIVNGRLSGGQTVVLRVSQSRGGYRVIDMNVSSVWLAQQLRSKFVSVIRKNGSDIDALFDFLRGSKVAMD